MACVKMEDNPGGAGSKESVCDVCLRSSGACFSKTDPIFRGKDVLAMIARYLDMNIIPTLVCQCCWRKLDEFDEFYRMVSEQHNNFIDTLKPSSTLADTRENSPAGKREEQVFGMEFVEIKHEPLMEDMNLSVKEEKEPLPECDDYDKLSPERSMAEEDDEDDPVDDDTHSLSSSDSEYSSGRRNGGKVSAAKREPVVDTELLEFYKRLVCEICDAERMLAGEPSIEYSNLREFNKHMRKAHDKAGGCRIKCPMCEKKFRYRRQLLEHRDMHLNPDQFRCVVCEEVHQNMVQHMRNKHQERTYCCEECGKRFPFKARLTAHVKKMHTSKDVVCDQCQKRYTIDDHKRAVHESKYICEHCPRTFKSRISLSQHMEEHVEGLRKSVAVTCDKCGVVLRDKYTLQTHIKRMHTEHPPASCGSCGKVFKSKHSLNAHMANVCTERTFPCPICEKQFKKKIKLTEHMTTHTKSVLYQCPYCSKTFSFETQLYTHRKRAHYEQWLEMQQKRKEGVRETQEYAAMATEARCEVCFFTVDDFCKKVFAEENKHIVEIVAKHLWFEIPPALKDASMCRRCWNALEGFHHFYCEIERARRQELTSVMIDVQQQAEVPIACESSELAHNTEFFEVKIEEPFESANMLEQESCDEQPLQCEFVKCEELNELQDPTAPSSEEDVPHEGSRSDSSSTDGRKRGGREKKPKPGLQISDSETKLCKAAAQKEEDESLHNFYKRIVCEVCDQQRMLVGEPQIDFGTWRALLRHTKEVHKHDKVFVKCPVCEMKMRTKQTLLQHMDWHENPENYRCELCGEKHQNMKEHIQNKHQERQFCCDVCGKKFPFKKRLTVHMKKMHVEKDIICDQCQKPFTKYTIEDHKRSVHSARFVCEHCPKTFNSRFRLLQHMEEHDESLRNSTSVPCTICGQVMRDKYILTRHIKLMHTVQPAVSCTTCGKTFKCKRNLSVHMTNVCMEPTRLYPCTICGKEFRRKNKLKEHMSTHTGKPLYMCSFCPETFRQDTHLYHHRKNAHYERWLEMQQQRKEGVTPTDECQWICRACWSSLDSFHSYYVSIEKKHQRHTGAADGLLDKERSTSPPSGSCTGPAYSTEFLEIKGEPVDEDDELDDQDEDGFDVTDGSGSDKMLTFDEIKSERDSEEDETVSSQADEGRRKQRSSRSRYVAGATKRDAGETLLAKRKAGGRFPADPEEDKNILEFYKRIVCEVCDNKRMMVGEPLIEYATWGELLRHTKELHGHYKIFVQCPVCETKLRTKVTLVQHMDMHQNPDKYRCEVCGEVYQNMKEHMQNKHEERQFSCDQCGSKFPFKKRLVVHMKKMHAEKDVTCDQCQKSFTKYTIEDHRRSVHMDRFVCEHCPKTFKIRFRLHKHMQEHDKSLRISTSVPCPTCGQVMGDKYILRQHIKHMHVEQQAVDCETCGKTFKNHRNLKIHLTNVCMKPVQLHPCAICGKQFRHKNKLKDHMASCTPN
uniref:C2H2-type domain-containing protein n=1 Tax=Anopheles epiroticus TaxID=199890 RepID=A0A182PQC3_9DIPT